MPADLVTLVRDHLRLPLSEGVLAALGRLQGRQIGSLRFWGQAREVAESLEPWMPIHILPLGTAGGYRRFGLLLDEKSVAGGDPPVVGVWKNRPYPPNVIGKANGLADYVLRELFDLEIEGAPELAAGVALASEAFGADLHQPGRLELRPGDEPSAVLHRLGRAPVDYYEDAMRWPPDGADEVALLAEGLTRHPDCLHLHALATRLLEERGDPAGAARHAVASLGCYHHTSLHETIDLDEHYERCASLARRLPDAFPPDALEIVELRSSDDRARMQHTMGLFTRGEIRAAEKTLADMCWDFQDYSNELIVKVLARHYEVLGWRWAQALCDLRALVV